MGEPKRGTKPNHMKTSNQKLVLDLIRRHQLPRSEIARITQLSKATVTLIVDDLISKAWFRKNSAWIRARQAATRCNCALPAIPA